MPPITILYPQIPAIPADFAELNPIFYHYLPHSLDKLYDKLTHFIQQPKPSHAAKQAAQAIQLELQQYTSQAQVHWIEAERNTSFPLFLKCLQIETLIQTAQFSAINQIIKTLPTIHHTNEPEALLYIAQTAVICGLPSIAMRLALVLPASQSLDDLLWAIKVLQDTHDQEAHMENQLLAAKNWLSQQGIAIECYGLKYGIVDEWLLDFSLFINEPDMKKLAHINVGLDNYLLDTFHKQLPSGICIRINSIQDIIETPIEISFDQIRNAKRHT